MKVMFERDSVCAGDDVFAPNRAEYSFAQPPCLSELLRPSAVDTYLPSVSGSTTYWTVTCDGKKAAQVEHSGSHRPQTKIRYLGPDCAQQVQKVFFKYERQERLLG